MSKLVNKRAGLPGDIYDVPKAKRLRAMSGHMRYASVRASDQNVLRASMGTAFAETSPEAAKTMSAFDAPNTGAATPRRI